MEVILNNLYDREFFENGGIIKTKKDEVINDCKTFIKLKIMIIRILSVKF